MRQEFEIALEMSIAHRVVPNAVTMALEPHPAHVRAHGPSLGFSRDLLVNWISAMLGGGPHLRRRTSPPMLSCAVKFFGRLGAPEAPAPYFPEAVLALSFLQCRKATFEGVPSRRGAAERALGHGCKPNQLREHARHQKRHMRGLRRGGSLLWAWPHAAVPEVEGRTAK